MTGKRTGLSVSADDLTCFMFWTVTCIEIYNCGTQNVLALVLT